MDQRSTPPLRLHRPLARRRAATRGPLPLQALLRRPRRKFGASSQTEQRPRPRFSPRGYLRGPRSVLWPPKCILTRVSLDSTMPAVQECKHGCQEEERLHAAARAGHFLCSCKTSSTRQCPWSDPPFDAAGHSLIHLLMQRHIPCVPFVPSVRRVQLTGLIPALHARRRRRAR